MLRVGVWLYLVAAFVAACSMLIQSPIWAGVAGVGFMCAAIATRLWEKDHDLMQRRLDDELVAQDVMRQRIAELEGRFERISARARYYQEGS